MKLLFCLECQDILKIINETLRTCHCGACTGLLCEDHLTATVTGPCQVLGVGANSVAEAVTTQTRVGDKGLRKMTTPAMQRIKDMQKTDPTMAWMLAASLPQSAYQGALKGRQFLAFVIPYKASTVVRDALPAQDYKPA